MVVHYTDICTSCTSCLDSRVDQNKCINQVYDYYDDGWVVMVSRDNS